mmetsp:Transcript_4402/g.9986  ORF Transcript_4402/g.9986 Transcript_4402/m.9986 type:complete len:206 (+) Transcript_4402:436-1053(+)
MAITGGAVTRARQGTTDELPPPVSLPPPPSPPPPAPPPAPFRCDLCSPPESPSAAFSTSAALPDVPRRSTPTLIRPTFTHSASQTRPAMPHARLTLPAPPCFANVGSVAYASADPRYMPAVVKLVSVPLSCGASHRARTVCTDGMITPCATPLRSLSKHVTATALPSRGSKTEMVAHVANAHASTRPPPCFFASHDPGICDVAYP